MSGVAGLFFFVVQPSAVNPGTTGPEFGSKLVQCLIRFVAFLGYGSDFRVHGSFLGSVASSCRQLAAQQWHNVQHSSGHCPGQRGLPPQASLCV